MVAALNHVVREYASMIGAFSRSRERAVPRPLGEAQQPPEWFSSYEKLRLLAHESRYSTGRVTSSMKSAVFGKGNRGQRHYDAFRSSGGGLLRLILGEEESTLNRQGVMTVSAPIANCPDLQHLLPFVGACEV